MYNVFLIFRINSNNGNFHDSALASLLLFTAKKSLTYKVNFHSTLITMSAAVGALIVTACYII